MAELLPPSRIATRLPIRKLFGCISSEPVKVADSFVKVRDYWLSYHDLYHLEVSYLKRIQLGRYKVSGIHGINSPMFHDYPIAEEYCGTLDEARVAVHEWLTRTSFFTTLKAMCWMIWLMSQGINPLAVLIRHIIAMRGHKHFTKLVDSMTFVCLEEQTQICWEHLDWNHPLVVKRVNNLLKD